MCSLQDQHANLNDLGKHLEVLASLTRYAHHLPQGSLVTLTIVLVTLFIV